FISSPTLFLLKVTLPLSRFSCSLAASHISLATQIVRIHPTTEGALSFLICHGHRRERKSQRVLQLFFQEICDRTCDKPFKKEQRPELIAFVSEEFCFSYTCEISIAFVSQRP
ncbi:hypothetical protein PanWU01x14_368820, partial [Parasponia andersonii]